MGKIEKRRNHGGNLEALGQSQSLGLLGMRERAAIFGGQVEIAGFPAKERRSLCVCQFNELIHGRRGADADPAVL